MSIKMKANYYTIHKNKKPKRALKDRRKVDIFTPLIASVSVMGVVRVNIISSQPALTSEQMTEKRLSILDAVIDTYKAINYEIPKQRMLHNFKTTKRYIK